MTMLETLVSPGVVLGTASRPARPRGRRITISKVFLEFNFKLHVAANFVIWSSSAAIVALCEAGVRR
jgi:hypothetical protein